MKKIFVFATNKEAKEILKSCHLIKIFSKNSKFYQWKTSCSFIFICGMGLENTKKNFHSFLSYKNYDIKDYEFINLGIAGACNPNLSLQSTYHISIVSNKDNEKIKLNSPKENSKSLISLKKAVWEEKQRKKLYSKGFDCIDMEAFALAYSLKKYEKDLKVIKVISDFCYKENEALFQKSIKSCSLILKNLFLELN